MNRGDLLLRLVRSINHPVDRMVVVNNGKNEGVIAALKELREQPNQHIGSLMVHQSPQNIGVAASWNVLLNYAFCSDPCPPYAMIVGNDIMFLSNDLERMDSFTRQRQNHIFIGSRHAYSMFCLTYHGFEEIGTFDENIFPAYFEDNDHHYRCKINGGKMDGCSDVMAIHGEAPNWGSSTIYSDPVMRRKNGVTFGINRDYYIKKWGGIPGEERFLTPFNKPDLTLKDWTRDPNLKKTQETMNM